MIIYAPDILKTPVSNFLIRKYMRERNIKSLNWPTTILCSKSALSKFTNWCWDQYGLKVNFEITPEYYLCLQIEDSETLTAMVISL